MQLLSLPSPVVTEGVKIYVDSPRNGGATVGELIALIPEPSAAMLFGLGGLALLRRRHQVPRISTVH
jgi:hypothetical protein